MALKKPDLADVVSFIAEGETNSVPALVVRLVDRDQGIIDLIAFFDPTLTIRHHSIIEHHYGIPHDDAQHELSWHHPVKGPQ